MSDMTVASISFGKFNDCISLAVKANGVTILDIEWDEKVKYTVSKFTDCKSKIEISDAKGSRTYIDIVFNETTLGTIVEIMIATGWCISDTCFLTHQSSSEILELLFAATRL